MATTGNPIVSNLVVGPIDRTASTPSISFGGDPTNNSGTGLYGAMGSVYVSASNTLVATIDSAGLTIATTLSVIGPKDVRLASDATFMSNAGVPVDGTSGTGAGFAGPGSMCMDITNKNAYINANTKASPTWKLVTRAA